MKKCDNRSACKKLLNNIVKGNNAKSFDVLQTILKNKAMKRIHDVIQK